MLTLLEEITQANPTLGELLARLEYEIAHTQTGPERNSLTIIRDYVMMHAMAVLEEDGILVPLPSS
jgi:hypothetical protein